MRPQACLAAHINSVRRDTSGEGMAAPACPHTDSAVDLRTRGRVGPGPRTRQRQQAVPADARGEAAHPGACSPASQVLPQLLGGDGLAA